MRVFLIGLLVLVSIILVVAVLLQPAKTDGFSLSGGIGETFYSKNKTRTAESTLRNVTIVSSIVFAGIVLALNLIK